MKPLRKAEPLIVYKYKGFNIIHPTDDKGNIKPFVYAVKDGLTYQIPVNIHATTDDFINTVKAFIDKADDSERNNPEMISTQEINRRIKRFNRLQERP